MTPADLTLPTPGANPLAVLPPRRRTGARVEPWISGVTAVEGIKILRPHNIGAYAKVGQNMDTRRAELTSVRDRSMSPRLVLAASKSTYALCSGSLIRKIELGWGSTM